MKGKRGFNYILVFSLLVIVLVGVTPALAQVCDPTCNPGSGTDDTAKINCCNCRGGIWCGTSSGGQCRGYTSFNYNFDGACEVTVDQTVILDYGYIYHISPTNPKKFEFDTFTVEDGITLQFYNTNYESSMPKALPATCAGADSSTDNSYPFGGSSIKVLDLYTASAGGNGGKGGSENKAFANPWGGGGGAGAGGGQIGYSGGDGYDLTPSSGDTPKYSGGAGSEPWHVDTDEDERGQCAADPDIILTSTLKLSGHGFGGYNGGRGGGFVNIKAETINIMGTISVNGEIGDSASPGVANDNHAGSGGFGGGPGAGGGGGGKIILYYNTITGSGTVTANGGPGGVGGSGGNGVDCGTGGAGGGGGGGAGGVISFISLVNDEDTPSIDTTCDGGAGGAPGTAREDGCGESKDKKPIPALKGSDGPSGFCGGSTEINPTDSQGYDITRCSDGVDNERDSLIDMDDLDCYTNNDWDASIWDEYNENNQKPSWYDRSGNITNGRSTKDLACGDDLGTCTTDPASIPSGECKIVPGKTYESYCVTDLSSCTYTNPYTGYYTGQACGCQKYWYDSETDSFKAYPFCMEDENKNCVYDYSYYYENYGREFCESLNEIDCAEEPGLCYWEPPEPGVSCGDFKKKANCIENENNGCVWNTPLPGIADLGGLTSDSKYLCLDSKTAGAKAITTPDNTYAWFGADGTIMGSDVFGASPYLIFQADKTQFISNGEKWFQCAAVGGINYAPQENRLSEYATFTMSELASGGDLDTCTGMLNYLIGRGCITDPEVDKDLKIYTCEGTNVGTCRETCSNNDNCGGWCFEDTFEEGNFGDFTTVCDSQCQLRTEEGYTQDINEVSIDCENGPSGTSDGGIEIDTDDGYSDFNLCKRYGDLCLAVNTGEQTSTSTSTKSLTCEGAHAALGFVYSGNSEKICNDVEYCNGGEFISVSNTDRCCLGQSATCREYNAEDCAGIGGEEKPSNCETCICTGTSVSGSSDAVPTCCVDGAWLDITNLNQDTNKAFMCYKENGNSFIQECCGVSGDCYNAQNELNIDKATKQFLLSPNTYSLDGVPLHGLMNFDRKKITDEGDNDVVELSAKVRTLKTGYNGGKQISLNNFRTDGFPDSSSYSFDWSSFDYLEFDLLYNVNTEYTIMFKDNDGTLCYYNLKDSMATKKGIYTWQHVAINIGNPTTGLTRCNNSNLDPENIVDIVFIIGGSPEEVSGVRLGFDNFFLKSNSNTENSRNMFCSGNWGQWVENLDGPSIANERGFYGTTPELSVYGPYSAACEGIASFGWTGTVCCGDDTKAGQYGEFWKDTEGACWKGTTIYNDRTVASSLGITKLMDEWETSLDERSLLYYNGELISCDREISNYESYLESFNGMDRGESIEVSSEVAEPYTIRGSWMCEEGEGWTNVKNVNRVRLLASTLKKIAEDEREDYTLMCGNFSDAVNLFGTMIESQKNMTGYSCVLRIGDNEDMGFGSSQKLIVGLEFYDPTTSYTSYKSSVLNKFAVMTINEESDECASVPRDVDADNFFTRCARSEESNFQIYYNSPLGLILLSDGRISSEEIVENKGFLSFIQGIWDGFKNFFSNLFGGEEQPVIIRGFDEEKLSKDFYVSVQGGKTITGTIESVGLNTSLRVDYTNLETDMSMLYYALKSNYPLAFVSYSAGVSAESQTIYLTALNSLRIDWRLITSMLRLNSCEDCYEDDGYVDIDWSEDYEYYAEINGITDEPGTGSGGGGGGSKGEETCIDDVRNQDETGIDCGGEVCPPCENLPYEPGDPGTITCGPTDGECPDGCTPERGDPDCSQCDVAADCPTGTACQIRTCTGDPGVCGFTNDPSCDDGGDSDDSGDSGGSQTTGFVVGYENTDVTEIPDCWIDKAKESLKIAYSHASHGDQLVSGMEALKSYDSSLYDLTVGWDWSASSWNSNKLYLREYQGWEDDENMFPGISDIDYSYAHASDVSHTLTDWADLTRKYLDGNSGGGLGSNINVMMWSWCGTGDGNDDSITPERVQNEYLNEMDALMNEYDGSPKRKVAFVLMTVHVSKWGETNSNNDRIRSWCDSHSNCILFDFADMEEHDPMGESYLSQDVSASLRYDCDSDQTWGCNWASEYLDSNSNTLNYELTDILKERLDDDLSACQHSPELNSNYNGLGAGESPDSVLNCALKGQAACYLWARLAGWDGESTTCS